MLHVFVKGSWCGVFLNYYFNPYRWQFMVLLLCSLTLIDSPTFIIEIHDCLDGAYKAGTVFQAREAILYFQAG